MEIAKKIAAKLDIQNQPPVTIAFLGDSVTQGCFECYMEGERIETVTEYGSAFASRVQEILHLLYPTVQINIINSGISGGAAPGGFRRLERDILPFSPDLVVVSFGLNDCCNPDYTVPVYEEAIRGIVTKLRQAGSEVIYLTQNFMNTRLANRGMDPALREGSRLNLQKQQDGILKQYMQAGAAAAEACGAEVLDLYSVWETLAANQVDTTALLANGINHPIRQYHWYAAIRIVERILGIR